MNNKYLLRIDVMNMLLRFMVTFAITSLLILFLTGEDTYIWRSLILLPGSILIFIIDKGTKNFWSYIILNLILLSIYMYLTEDVLIRVIYGAYLILFAVAQFLISLSKTLKNITLVSVLPIIVVYAICVYNYPDMTLFRRVILYGALAYGIIYILSMYLINFYTYFKKYEDKANIPLNQIKVSNRVYILLFMVLSLCAMMLFTRLPLDKILIYLGGMLKKVLRFILSFLYKNTNGIEQEVVQEVAQEVVPQDNMMDLPNSEPSQFWVMLEEIILRAFTIFIVLFVIAIILYGIYKVYQLYYQKKVTIGKDEKVENISPFEKKVIYLDPNKTARRSVIELFSKSNNDKIRKQYRKAIQKNTLREEKLKFKTPSELSKYVMDFKSQRNDDNILQCDKETLITTIYEKARYSGKECNKEEVLAVKNLLK